MASSDAKADATEQDVAAVGAGPSKATMTPEEAFRQYDRDNSGFIDFEEFKDMLPDLGLIMNEAQTRKYFKICDADASGAIDFDEFRVALYTCDPSSGNTVGFQPSKLLTPKDAFAMFDEDNNGTLDYNEFLVLVEFMGLEEERATELFSYADRNKTGTITFEEFERIWLRMTNVVEELKARGVPLPRIQTRGALVRKLQEVLAKEEEREQMAVSEARQWQTLQRQRRVKERDAKRAKRRALEELAAAMDMGGQVYLFSSLSQFHSEPQWDSYLHDWADRLSAAWRTRIGHLTKEESSEEEREKAAETGNAADAAREAWLGQHVGISEREMVRRRLREEEKLASSSSDSESEDIFDAAAAAAAAEAGGAGPITSHKVAAKRQRTTRRGGRTARHGRTGRGGGDEDWDWNSDSDDNGPVTKRQRTGGEFRPYTVDHPPPQRQRTSGKHGYPDNGAPRPSAFRHTRIALSTGRLWGQRVCEVDVGDSGAIARTEDGRCFVWGAPHALVEEAAAEETVSESDEQKALVGARAAGNSDAEEESEGSGSSSIDSDLPRWERRRLVAKRAARHARRRARRAVRNSVVGRAPRQLARWRRRQMGRWRQRREQKARARKDELRRKREAELQKKRQRLKEFRHEVEAERRRGLPQAEAEQIVKERRREREKKEREEAAEKAKDTRGRRYRRFVWGAVTHAPRQLSARAAAFRRRRQRRLARAGSGDGADAGEEGGGAAPAGDGAEADDEGGGGEGAEAGAAAGEEGEAAAQPGAEGVAAGQAPTGEADRTEGGKEDEEDGQAGEGGEGGVQGAAPGGEAQGGEEDGEGGGGTEGEQVERGQGQQGEDTEESGSSEEEEGNTVPTAEGQAPPPIVKEGRWELNEKEEAARLARLEERRAAKLRELRRRERTQQQREVREREEVEEEARKAEEERLQPLLRQAGLEGRPTHQPAKNRSEDAPSAPPPRRNRNLVEGGGKRMPADPTRVAVVTVSQAARQRRQGGVEGTEPASPTKAASTGRDAREEEEKGGDQAAADAAPTAQPGKRAPLAGVGRALQQRPRGLRRRSAPVAGTGQDEAAAAGESAGGGGQAQAVVAVPGAGTEEAGSREGGEESVNRQQTIAAPLQSQLKAGGAGSKGQQTTGASQSEGQMQAQEQKEEKEEASPSPGLDARGHRARTRLTQQERALLRGPEIQRGLQELATKRQEARARREERGGMSEAGALLAMGTDSKATKAELRLGEEQRLRVWKREVHRLRQKERERKQKEMEDAEAERATRERARELQSQRLASERTLTGGRTPGSTPSSRGRGRASTAGPSGSGGGTSLQGPSSRLGGGGGGAAKGAGAGTVDAEFGHRLEEEKAARRALLQRRRSSMLFREQTAWRLAAGEGLAERAQLVAGASSPAAPSSPARHEDVVLWDPQKGRGRKCAAQRGGASSPTPGGSSVPGRGTMMAQRGMSGGGGGFGGGGGSFLRVQTGFSVEGEKEEHLAAALTSFRRQRARGLVLVAKYFEVWDSKEMGSYRWDADKLEEAIMARVRMEDVKFALDVRGKRSVNQSRQQLLRTLATALRLERSKLSREEQAELRQMELRTRSLESTQGVHATGELRSKMLRMWAPLRARQRAATVHEQRYRLRIYFRDAMEMEEAQPLWWDWLRVQAEGAAPAVPRPLPASADEGERPLPPGLLRVVKAAQQRAMHALQRVVLAGITPRGRDPCPVQGRRHVVRAIAMGAAHAGLVSASGALLMWGSGEGGRLGLPANSGAGVRGGRWADCAEPTPVGTLAEREVLHVACGTLHSLALLVDGSVAVWGTGKHGQLGLDDLDSTLPARPVPDASVLTAAAKGAGLALWPRFDAKHAANGPESAALALASPGAGSQGTSQALVAADSLAGSAHSQVGWRGGESAGEWLRQGAVCAVPVIVPLRAAGRVIRVSCGAAHSAAVTDAGQLFVWGCGDSGRLGLGGSSDVGSPALVDALSHTQVANVSCGRAHTLVVTRIVRRSGRDLARTASMRAQGRLEEGEDPLGGVPASAGPRPITGAGIGPHGQLRADTRTAQAEEESVLRAGGPRQWGTNQNYRGGEVYAAGAGVAIGTTQFTFKRVEALQPYFVTAVAAGSLHSAALTTEGSLFTWGTNRGGCAGHPSAVRDIRFPRQVTCLHRYPFNLARGRQATMSTQMDPRTPAAKAVNGDRSGLSAHHCAHSTREVAPWWEVDLGRRCQVHVIKLWNRTDQPPGQVGGKGDYFSRRLFPCWLLVSLRRFDRGQQGTASLQAARVKALYATRLEQDKRVHEWRLPADAVGRYVRVQLESETWLHFAELEVIGVPGVQRSPGPIAGVSCGHESMAVWTRALEQQYLRAVRADVVHATILRTLETFFGCWELYGPGNGITECHVCADGLECEICTFQRRWCAEEEVIRDEWPLQRMRLPLDTVIEEVLESEPPFVTLPPDERVGRCRQAFQRGARWMRNSMSRRGRRVRRQQARLKAHAKEVEVAEKRSQHSQERQGGQEGAGGAGGDYGDEEALSDESEG